MPFYFLHPVQTIENSKPRPLFKEGSREELSHKSLSKWSAKMKEVAEAMKKAGIPGFTSVKAASDNLQRACRAIEDGARPHSKRHVPVRQTYILEY